MDLPSKIKPIKPILTKPESQFNFGNIGELANTLLSGVNALYNQQGNTSTVGNVLSGIGSAASLIPGVGGLIGAGTNLLGGLYNAAFGSNINENAVA